VASPSLLAPRDEASSAAFYSAAESPADRTAQATSSQDDIPPTADVIFASHEMTVESLLRWHAFGPEMKDRGHPPPLISILGRSRSASDHAPSLDHHIAVEPQVVANLVANFLSNNHVKNPIFDVGTLWEDVRKFADEGLGWDGRSCLIVRTPAVCRFVSPAEYGPRL
jgi:hypothetical protein